MNYRKHRRKIEKTYEDKATISRYGKVKKPNGETKNELAPVYVDQPCRISQKALAVNGQREAQNVISYETKLFISPELEIKQGDTIEVVRGHTTTTYTAGEPFPYPTHQEVILQRKDKA
ncbi:ABC transporter ATP-binding protein [Paenibacillus thiaminolyticus]|uniref:ABC transporter ATP-binding protein n=1 Tax=Paenibacillus thiaminolyticus TaxID=49283 RepID=UPI0011641F15|nr:ABC transporter ATP-binding protein [Paenibacillus thiaminolyticus]NGP58156.1 ABC transporter ATP-binding protein [Paenibacillus thiaminolyticus]